MDQTGALGDDTLAEILRRLPPRNLAAARSSRKAWRAVVDAHGLLLPYVLPHAVRGLFVNYSDCPRPRFFARLTPPTEPAIDGSLDFLPRYSSGSRLILDHCNGLLLSRDGNTLCVVNPATRRWERLPGPCREDDDCNAYLVFDPAVSLGYDVFSIPRDWEPEPQKKVVLNPSVPNDESTIVDTEQDSEDGSSQHIKKKVRLSPQQYEEAADLSTNLASQPIQGGGENQGPHDLMECPPFSWTLNVFSSCTREWKKKTFVREGKAMAAVTSMPLDPLERRSLSGSVYWQGSLYVHFRGAFIVRLSSLAGKYRVIKAPIDIKEYKNAQTYVGKSEKGVYFAAIHDKYQLRVWNFVESSGHVDWVLKHQTDLEPCATVTLKLRYLEGVGKTWILDDDNNDVRLLRGENFGWDSDDDNVVDARYGYRRFCSYVRFLGFHPYKEVVFLGLASSIGLGVAYHLNSSKIQYMGRLHQKVYTLDIGELFPYTPCMIDVFKKASDSLQVD